MSDFLRACRSLETRLDSTETHDVFHDVQPDRLRHDLLLYRQDLRMVIRRLSDAHLRAIETTMSERCDQVVASVADFEGAIADRNVARLGVAMIRLGGMLAESAEHVGVVLPPTVFLGVRTERSPRIPPDEPRATRRSVFSWISGALSALFVPIRFIFGAVKGKPLGFDAPDGLSEPDLYTAGEPFGPRVFISYEGSSLPLAEKFEAALRRVGLEPYRYAPGKKFDFTEGKWRLKDFRAAHPGIGEEIIRTVRRSSAVVFLLSEAAVRSPLCQLEAFAARVTFSPFHSGIYVITETPDIRVESLLLEGTVLPYKPGLEEILAREIEENIEQLASFRTTAEALRSKRWKSG